MPRTITIHSVTNDLVGDETYEAWLKHESDAWTLVDAGDVDQVSGAQDFVFPGLIDGADYSLQLRMKRAGRYRIGYLSGDPESWPAGSRLDFTVGSLIDVGAPTFDALDDWVRVDADHTKFTVHITPDDTTQNLELYRDGVLVHTFVQPLASPIVYDDVDPPLGVDHAYKARHVAGTLGGPFSATLTKFAGPPPATGFDQTSPLDTYGKYTVSWDNDARTYRLEDDWRCVSTTFELVTGGAAITTGTHEEQKETTEIPEGATQSVFCHARVRAEVTTFGVTDVSAWEETVVECLIDDPDDDTQHNTCP